MKFLHIADLHIGKRVCEYPMLQDQRHILKEIADLARAEGVDALLVAGDVYDRPVPPQEAVTLLSEFLCDMARQNVKVCLIAGNHDSAERLEFCAELLGAGGIHIQPSLFCGNTDDLISVLFQLPQILLNGGML